MARMVKIIATKSDDLHMFLLLDGFLVVLAVIKIAGAYSSGWVCASSFFEKVK